MALLFVADALAEVFFERGEEVEGDVGGLEFLAVGVGDVVHQGAVGGGSGSGLDTRWGGASGENVRGEDTG